MPDTSNGYHFKVNHDPTLSVTQFYLASHRAQPEDCTNPAPEVLVPMMCVSRSTPAPSTIYNYWDVAFTPGSDFTGVTFGGYYQSVPVGFHPSFAACAGKTGHDLAADATALASAVSAGYAKWSSSANAAEVEQLLSDYAAGEIGAAAFIAGIVDILTVVVVAAIIVGTALTLYSLISVAECVLSGDSIGYIQAQHFPRSIAT